MNKQFKSLILVNDKSQVKSAQDLYHTLFSLGKQPLLVTDEGIEINGQSVKNIGEYQELFKIKFQEVKQQAYDLFYSLSERKVCGDTTLRQLTKYQTVSLWDLTAHYIFAELIPIFYYFKITTAILDYENPDEVYIIDYVNCWEKIFSLVCCKRKINCTLRAVAVSQVYKIKNYLGNPITFLKKIKRFLVSFGLLIMNLLESHHLNKTYKILFFAPTERFFISMLSLILKYNNSERLVINDFLSGSESKLKERGVSYMHFYGFRLYKIFDRASGFFLRNIEDTICKNKFLNKVLYEDICLEPLLKNVFKRAIYVEFLERMREIDITRKIILAYKPKVVVVGGAAFKTTLIVKSLAIPVVALQSIHPIDFIFFAPVKADFVTVDGSSWREYLLRRGVAPEKICITGPLKFDPLAKQELHPEEYSHSAPFNTDLSRTPRLKARGSQRADYGVKPELTKTASPPEKKVIFTTNYSSLAMGSLRYQNLERIKNVCKAIKNIGETHLLIKLHPYDRDYEVYEDIAKEIGLKNYSITREGEILDIIYACDLLITHISATSYEAVLMDKNVILLSRSSDFQTEDVWDYRKYGAVIFIEEFSELEDYIRNVLLDTATISLLKRNRREYIQAHAYNLDGNASFRAKELIDGFSSN